MSHCSIRSIPELCSGALVSLVTDQLAATQQRRKTEGQMETTLRRDGTVRLESDQIRRFNRDLNCTAGRAVHLVTVIIYHNE
ncbi:hypothetical protein ATANTOWER_005267 [Ataeniobius toweri]|uniref:Uncharacterized protein n=1 Tax=Ataeniobius toweri TaxID=208326 RepID=A0ABU7BH45_9TELE|nr:hypothetical protein [Ataeniobius toweri]